MLATNIPQYSMIGVDRTAYLCHYYRELPTFLRSFPAWCISTTPITKVFHWISKATYPTKLDEYNLALTRIRTLHHNQYTWDGEASEASERPYNHAKPRGAASNLTITDAFSNRQAFQLVGFKDTNNIQLQVHGFQFRWESRSRSLMGMQYRMSLPSNQCWRYTSHGIWPDCRLLYGPERRKNV